MKCEYCGRTLTPGLTQCPGCGAPIEYTNETKQEENNFTQQANSFEQQVNNVPPVYAQTPGYTGGEQVEYAGFMRRVVAAVIDWIIMMVGCSTGVGAPLAFFYLPLCEALWDGATIGKKAVGIKVVNYQYEKITMGQAFGRFFSKFLSSIFWIGYIMVAFSEKKQGLHDRMAGTYVIKVR